MDKFTSNQNDFHELSAIFNNLTPAGKNEITKFILLEIAHGTKINTTQLMKEIEIVKSVHKGRG